MLLGSVALLTCFFPPRLLFFENITANSLNQWLEEKKAHFHIFFILSFLLFSFLMSWIHHFMINFTLDCLLSSCSQSGFHLHNVEWSAGGISHRLCISSPVLACCQFLKEAASVAKTCDMGILILITGPPAAPEQEATGWNVFGLLVLAFALASGCKTPSHPFAPPR